MGRLICLSQNFVRGNELPFITFVILWIPQREGQAWHVVDVHYVFVEVIGEWINNWKNEQMLSKCPLSSEYRVEALHVIWFLLSSSFYDSPFWHKFPSKQCQNTVKKLPIPSGSKGRKMCPWQFGEFGHGKEVFPKWTWMAKTARRAQMWRKVWDRGKDPDCGMGFVWLEIWEKLNMTRTVALQVGLPD